MRREGGARRGRGDDRDAREDGAEVVRAPADEAEDGLGPEGDDARAAADDALGGDAK